MDIRDIGLLSFGALRDRKVRSILTILMVAVGSGLMIALNGMGAGFNVFIEEQFDRLSPNTLFITPTPPDVGGGFGGFGGPPPASKVTLNFQVERVLRSIPAVGDVVPVYQGAVIVQARGMALTASVFSMDPPKIFILDPALELIEGSDIRSNDPTGVLIGHEIANPVGEDRSFAVLGQAIRVRYSFIDVDTGRQNVDERTFFVKGILKPTGNPTLDKVLVVETRVGNSLLHKSNKYDMLLVLANSREEVSIVEEEVRSIYGNNLGITTPASMLKTIQEFTGGFRIFINGIAVVALLVGSVGIVTTLYTSVTERTREIGTMKAMGAQKAFILGLFLIEGLVIGILGVTVGSIVGIGGGFALVAGFSSSEGPSISPAFLLGDLATIWLLSLSLSVVAAILPAWKASKVSPVEALRHD
ncbi:MAG: ABC transporter permease [Thaumarchaeota archaeon]|nr:ABC transporter permease [Nitrososphaerota archaeon]